MQEFLLHHCSASRVVIFDHTVRRPGTNRGPIPRTHVDQTTKGEYAPLRQHAHHADVLTASIARVERHMPGISGQLLQNRFQIINVWRPVRNAAYKSPLALCDFQTVGVEDMIATDRVILDKPDTAPGETYSIAFSEQHRWYYNKDLATNQVILIK